MVNSSHYQTGRVDYRAVNSDSEGNAESRRHKERREMKEDNRVNRKERETERGQMVLYQVDHQDDKKCCMSTIPNKTYSSNEEQNPQQEVAATCRVELVSPHTVGIMLAE